MHSQVLGTLSTKISATNSPPRSNLNSSLAIGVGLPWLTHERAAVYRQRLPGNEARLIAREEQRRAGDFLDGAEAPQRRDGDQPLAQLLRPAGGHIGLDV